MKKSNAFKWVYIITVLCIQLQGAAQTNTTWPAVNKETHPWTRWWWMGSAVDEQSINSQLTAFSKAGFGGVEIVPIYGAIGYENKYISYLSPKWIGMLDYTTAKAASLKMGVDMAVGTGWPIGGPQVTPVDAATKLLIQTYTVEANQPLKEKVTINDTKQKAGAVLAALMAYGNKGEVIDITNKVLPDGSLVWVPESGRWNLYAAFTAKTRQAVKRAALGGEGFTLDHFSKAAINNYFKTFDTAFGTSAHGVRSFFNDSYEVFGADWTPDFFSEFQQRRGYDLKPYLNILVSKENNEALARIKSDYRETMSELMLLGFTKNFTQWAHSKKALNTNQAHGSPGNLLDLYAAVDIPECETFGSSHFDIPGLRRDPADVRNVDPDPNMLKFASSAANAMGKPYTSCETFTWLTEHFKTSWSQCKPEVEQAFLSGINHVFYHGTTYSPNDAPWPGWLFYASVNFVPNNSLWPHLNGLNNYITRCQSVLQSGKPDNEIMIYWPVYDAWNNASGMDLAFKIHDIDQWLHPTPFYKNLVELQEKGYSLDFVSDKMLAASSVKNGILKVAEKGASHKVLVISQCKMMPIPTLQRIIDLAKNGANVVIQKMPEDVPGLNNLAARRLELANIISKLSFTKINDNISIAKLGEGRIILSADIKKGLEYMGVEREQLTDLGLKFIRRSVADGKYYYIVNHTVKTIDEMLPLQTTAQSAILLDPQSGNVGTAYSVTKGKTTLVKVQLLPGEAMIIKTSTTKATIPEWKYLHKSTGVIALNNNAWKVHFTQGGPALPNDKVLQPLSNWTEMLNDTLQSFSGSAEYSTTFILPRKDAADYSLQLGVVNESAKVWINGSEVGILWSIPFTANIGKYLKEGENAIKVEVANLMANRMRNMDQKGIVWRKYHEINFVNINYKDFDAAKWNVMPSGLQGPVLIVPMSLDANK